MTIIRANRLLSYSIISGALLLGIHTESAAQRKKATARIIHPDFFGVTLNTENFDHKGGISAELISNHSFLKEEGERFPAGWSIVRKEGAAGTMNHDTERPLHEKNKGYLVLNSENPGKIGLTVRNRGFEGIYVREGQNFKLSFYAREEQGNSLKLVARLVNKDGLIIDEERFESKGSDWQKYEAVLSSPITEGGASLEIGLLSRGSLALDMVSLKPAETFMNHGFRADISQAVADLHPSFVRLKIGNLANWKKGLGAPEERDEKYSEPGLFEYLQFCEDIGSGAVPVVALEGDKANEDETEAYIREILGLLEFATSTDRRSSLAKKRAEMGHEKPFNIAYLTLGDREKMTSKSVEKFTAAYKAIKREFPEIKVIGSAGESTEGSDYATAWEMATDLRLPFMSEQLHENAVWLDENRDRYDFFNRNDSKVVVGEFTSSANDLKSAITEAAFLSNLEKNADVVSLVSYAPVLDEENGLLEYDAKGVYPTANYYVQQLFASNLGDEFLDRVTYVREFNKAIAVSCVRDNESGDVIVKISNNADKDGHVQIDLRRLSVETLTMEQSMIRNKDGKIENTVTNPNAVVPKHRKLKVGASNFMVDSWANSYMVLRFSGNKSTAMR